MISRFFIDRPVLANVLALFFVLIGLVALIQLPTSQYPNVVPPTVQVTTRYPGASARTLVDTVALPLEQNVNGVENMLYMQSTSADDGTYTLVVTFAIGTDPDEDEILVQNRVSAAISSLPLEVQVQGVTTKKKSTSILEYVGLTSPDGRFDSLFLANYAVINVVNELERLPGIGDVSVIGAGQYAMRIWMNPDLLQARGLTPQDVINVIQQQSQEVAAGQIGAPPAPKGQDFQYTLNLKGRLDDPAEFENIIVKVDSANGGRITRIRDIGHAELGAQTYSEAFNYDGKPAAGIGISLLPGANAIDGRQQGEGENGRARQELPGGPHIRHALRHDEIRQGRDQRSLPDAVRGSHSGADRHSGLPAGLARHAGAGHDCAGDHHRRLRRDGRAGFFDQSPNPVRAHPCDRHRRRRRDRHCRGRLALCRARHSRPRGGRQGDGRSHRSGHRHHPGADVGFHPRRFPAGADRADLPPIRSCHRSDRLHQRHQRDDLEAHAKRVVAQAADAERAAQLFCPRLQCRLRRRRARLFEAHGRDDPPEPGDGGPRAFSCRWRDLGTDPGADRVPADRGPGLPDRRRAAARRRLQGAHGCGDGQDFKDCRGRARRRSRGHRQRHLDLRQSGEPRQRGRWLCHPEGLGRPP